VPDTVNTPVWVLLHAGLTFTAAPFVSIAVTVNCFVSPKPSVSI
jgi:hypothetical protein